MGDMARTTGTKYIFKEEDYVCVNNRNINTLFRICFFHFRLKNVQRRHLLDFQVLLPKFPVKSCQIPKSPFPSLLVILGLERDEFHNLCPILLLRHACLFVEDCLLSSAQVTPTPHNILCLLINSSVPE